MPRNNCARCILLLAALSAATESAADVSYNGDVRPLLSAHCFRCHGPDEAERQADLRLDQPGDTDFDEVLRRIESVDPDEQMPPPAANKPLSPQNVRTLKKWFAAGAPYEPHWAFVHPEQPTVPVGQHPVDYFIDSRLAELGIVPAEQADPYTLVRRVYLDLIGLPPTLEQADAFAADPSDQAYDALVDDLLKSPHYGERWARRWLDLARYADTNGYEKDRDRSIWPYRDWVIRALNADMPFDQFTIEQLAGDMLPDATAEQLVATGFHRNTMLNEEGGIDPQEFRYHAVVDRVATTGTTWLGLTLGCAQCHTHKFDPVTHHDYFGIMAYLNNADEPDFELPDAALQEEHRQNAAAADELLVDLPQHWPGGLEALEAAFDEWLQSERREHVDWRTLLPTQAEANVPYLVHEGDGVLFAGGDTSKHDIFELTFVPLDTPVAALRLEVLPDERLPGRGPGKTFYEGSKGDFFLTEFIVAGAAVAEASETYAKNQFKDKPTSAAMAVDGDIQSGWTIAGRTGERHVAVFKFDEPLPAGEAIRLEMHFGRHFASTLGKFRISATPDSDALLKSYSTEVEHLLGLPADELLSSQRDKLKQAFLLQAPELAEQVERIVELRTPPRGVQTLIMCERPDEHPRPNYLYHRGEYVQPTERVGPRLPEAILPDDMPAPQNRLEFAEWLVSEDNPLTARVVANRHWAALFGSGIVSTVNDFGMQGAPPTHPKLLDHVAVFLVENNWSIKSLHRHIVTSAAYRRSSSIGETAADSRWLARFPRQRIEAEIIRDAALQAAGLLNDEMFGPPIRPPQPTGISEVAYGGKEWNPSPTPDRYRRSIYTYQKRTAPFAMLTTFDAGSGESCLAQRDRSNTPLQALTLLNDPMFVEICDAFGRQLERADGDATAKIVQAFRRILTRPPTEEEQARILEFYQQHESWPAVARALLCLDEAVMKN